MPPSRCVEADIQFFISGFGVKAVAFGKAQLGLQIAESVEKVGAVRLFATSFLSAELAVILIQPCPNRDQSNLTSVSSNLDYFGPHSQSGLRGVVTNSRVVNVNSG